MRLAPLALAVAPWALLAAPSDGPPARTANPAAVAAAPPTRYALLEAEHARRPDTALFRAARESGDPALQRLAARALGRLEQPQLVDALRPFLALPNPEVRATAAWALAQSGGTAAWRPADWRALLRAEATPEVRGALYESWGRRAAADSGTEQQLAAALTEAGAARTGALRGMEAYLRRTARAARPTAGTVQQLREVAQEPGGPRTDRLLALLALTAAGDRDAATVDAALRDADPDVRRVAVALGRRWVEDPAPMVRWQALRVAGTCARAEAHVTDSSAHVALLALDLLGELRCAGLLLATQARDGTTWQHRAHATAALARMGAPEAATAVRRLANAPEFQARMWAVTAARLAKDSVTLRRLARDAAPTVAAAAIASVDDALRALRADHAGLVLAGAEFLKGSPALGAARPALVQAFERLTSTRPITWRDPRVALLERIIEAGDDTPSAWLEQRLDDADPAVAALAARALSARTGTPVAPRTRALPVPAFPAESLLAAWRGATAVLTMAGLGTMTVRLDVDEAPATVAVIAALAQGGGFDGRTLHRVVPNFVLQGGSPGADEYDPATAFFMRDEVGGRHRRGTLGISTRGRDTGDGQLFFNLVDNVRLDHDYTVFGEVVAGLDVMDRVQEGAVITSVRIERAAGGAGSDAAGVVGARTPAFGPDGQLAYTVDGQVVVAHDGTGVRLSAGSAWHRDPSFTRDGAALLYAADSAGRSTLWSRPWGAAAGATGATRLTGSAEGDAAPQGYTVFGQLLFTRGRGNASRLWVREPDGREHRFSRFERTELHPRLSPDGRRVAFIVAEEAHRHVAISLVPAPTTRPTDIPPEQRVTADSTVEALAWGPDDRLALAGRAGVTVVPVSGSWRQTVSRHRAEVAWSADGAALAVAPVAPVAVAYNGDPDRGLDRSALRQEGALAPLAILSAPAPPDVGAHPVGPVAVTPRAAANAEAFDRLWERSAQLYFAAPEAADRLAAWQAVRAAQRPRALAATTDRALDDILHAALQQRPPLRAEARGHAAVSSAHPVATAAGLEVLRQGGNVVDAAVAVSFALGVVEPDASGIGGYGQMLIARAGAAAPSLIDFMSRVPEAAGLDNRALLVNGRYPADGPVLTNVPGTVAGMYLAWQRYGSGRLPWKALLAPAIRAARGGYAISDGLATTLATEQEHFRKYPGSVALFFRGGAPRAAGDTLRNPDLAWVLEQVAEKGAAGFYEGEVARRWVADLRAGGNAMTERDLARYFAVEREPVRGRYRGYTVFSSAPPVSGGAELVARLNLLEQHAAPRAYTDDAATLHAMLTAWQLVPSARGRIADPAFWPVQVEPIIHRDTARARWGCYTPARALTAADLRGTPMACLAPPPGAPPVKAAPPAREESSCGDDHAAEVGACHSAGTTAFTVADADGNVVAVTQTLGTWGGTFHVTPGLGFLSNDKLTSYGTDPLQYGARLPFARHGSTLAPTIAYRDGRPVFAVGAAGNAWITAAVYQALVGALDFGLGPQAALELPRFLPGGAAGAGGRPAVQLEDGFSPEVVARLRALGYALTFVSLRGELREGYGAAVRLEGRTVTAGGDPRRSGAAGAIESRGRGAVSGAGAPPR
jgi:gamma-glutamyltranspeptidase